MSQVVATLGAHYIGGSVWAGAAGVAQVDALRRSVRAVLAGERAPQKTFRYTRAHGSPGQVRVRAWLVGVRTSERASVS